MCGRECFSPKGILQPKPWPSVGQLCGPTLQSARGSRQRPECSWKHIFSGASLFSPGPHAFLLVSPDSRSSIKPLHRPNLRSHPHLLAEVGPTLKQAKMFPGWPRLSSGPPKTSRQHVVEHPQKEDKIFQNLHVKGTSVLWRIIREYLPHSLYEALP